METERIIEILEDWVKRAKSIRSSSYSNGNSRLLDFGPGDTKTAKSLIEQEDQIRRLLAGVLKLNTLPVVLSREREFLTVMDGVKLAEYAIGRLRTDADTRLLLGPSAPTMAADQLHPTVWGVVAGLWEQGHYRVCVQKAITRLNGNVQDSTNRHDVSDRELMQQVFSTSPPQPGKPRLWWRGRDSDLTVKSMREGMLNFSQGVFSAIRNVTSHTTTELHQQEAFEMLASVSLLARWIDQCDLVEA